MNVNQTRIVERIEKIASFDQSKEPGISRFSYSEGDRSVRRWIAKECEAMGMTVCTDAIGNIRVRYDGKQNELAPVLIGSHIDSVRNGGKYDGIVGSVGALEVLSVLHENNYRPLRPLEMILFAEEEGSNFGTTMVGSKVLIGKLKEQGLKNLKAADGRTAMEMAKDFGLEPENIADYVLKEGDIHSMMELHIEQGVVLDRENKKLGVVKAIAGMSTLRIKISGVSNHAGSTPMNMRIDPMPAAAALILEIERIAASEVLSSTVATVGSIQCKPDMPNVIPSEVTFTVDVRDIDDNAIDRAVQMMMDAAEELTSKRGVSVMSRVIGTSQAVILNPRVVGVIKNSVMQVTEKAGVSGEWMEMNSGAVHDAAMMATITDVGMIFVPSVKGKSHCPQEYTKPEDIALGCSALLESALQLTDA